MRGNLKVTSRFRVDPELLAAARVAADRNQVSVSHLIRRALRRELQDEMA
jgi:predicted HicB family RNase H-like nuclease